MVYPDNYYRASMKIAMIFPITHIISLSDENNMRLDLVLAKKYSDYSRSFFTRLINDGLVFVNQTPCKKSGTIVYIGDSIYIENPKKKTQNLIESTEKQQIKEIKIIFDHEHFLIIDKPAGLLTHQANPHDQRESLIDFLLKQYPALAAIGYQGRPGIVHRLDKDTSGLLIIPKTTMAHLYFSNAFKDRTITKEYIAIIAGSPERNGIINFPIGRDPYQKTKMKAFKTIHKGIKIREAITEFTAHTYYQNTTKLSVKPKTGRTHQIRVHLAAHGYPIIGDAVYGTTSPLITRHALHAHAVSFEFQNQQFRFESEIPSDMQNLMNSLRTPSP